MPTTTDEAAAIVAIFNDYLTPQQAQEITCRLANEVGNTTDNSSLKISLEMLQAIYKDMNKGPSRTQMCPLWSLAALHGAILICNIVAIALLPFFAPWYVALPLITLLVNLMFSPVSCPLTRLESRLRQSLNLPEIRHFIKHYAVDPIKKRQSKP